MARDSLDISDDKDDGKKQKETESGDNTNHLDEYRLNRYIISKDPYAFDASGWTLDQIKEHQRLMEMNRDEAEKSYELACTQLNTLIAVSGIALSIVVSCMFAFNDSNSSVIVASCCFIASSLIISAYSSLRSRRVLASYPTGWMPQIMSKSLEQQIISNINVTLLIEESHIKQNDKKRAALNYAMILFIIGICCLVFGLIVQVFSS